MSGVSSVIIEVLSDKGESRQRVELRGPALPFQGATWGGELAMVTTWYPGNSEGTQQVLGPREVPSEWNGLWRRTQMGHAPSYFVDTEAAIQTNVISPDFLRDRLEEIFRSGQRLRVSWVSEIRMANNVTQPRSIVREGRAKKWDFPHDRMEDIAWKINFEWVGRGQQTQKVISVRDESVSSALTKLAKDQEAALSKILSLKPLRRQLTSNPINLTLGQLEALANTPNRILNQFARDLSKIQRDVQRAGDIAKKFASIPVQLRNTALMHVQNAIASAHQFLDRMSATPLELTSAKARESDIARSAKFFGQRMEDSRPVALAAYQAQQGLIQVKNPSGQNNGALPAKMTQGTMSRTVLAVHIVRQGETLITISKKFYGSPDFSEAIAHANHLAPYLPLTSLVGKPIIIPVVVV